MSKVVPSTNRFVCILSVSLFCAVNPQVANAACIGGSIQAALCATSGFSSAASAVGNAFGTEFLGVQFPLTGGGNYGPGAVGYGIWSRGFVDQSRTKATLSTSALGGGSISGRSTTDTQGLQFGFDVGKFNIEDTNWNVQVGVTGGSVWLTPTNSNGSNFSVPFVGGYVTATNGGFFAQTQLLRGFVRGTITSPDANLASASSTGHVLSWSGLVGYHYMLGDWSIEPTAGFSLTRLAISNLNVGGGASALPAGVLSFNSVNSDLGYTGLRLGHTFDMGGYSLNPYVSASVWNDFNKSSSSTFSNTAISVPINTSRIGTFGQFSIGSSAYIPNTGLTGFVRGDYRTGDNINGWAVTGGVRFTF